MTDPTVKADVQHSHRGHSMLFWGVIAASIVALIVIAICVTLFLIKQPTAINGKIIRVARCDNKSYSIEHLTIDVYDKQDTKITLPPAQIDATSEYYQIDLGTDTAINKIVINNLLSNPASILGCNISVTDKAGEVILMNKFNENAIIRPMDRATTIAIYDAKHTSANKAVRAAASATPANTLELNAAKAAAMKVLFDARLSVTSVTATWMKGVAQKLPAAAQAAKLWDTAVSKGAAYIALPAHAQAALAEWETAEDLAKSTIAYAEAVAADAAEAKDAAVKVYTTAQAEKKAANINTPEMTFATTKEENAKAAKDAWEIAVTKATKAVSDSSTATRNPTAALKDTATTSADAAYSAAKAAYALTMLVPEAAKPTFTLTATRNIFTTTHAYHLA